MKSYCIAFEDGSFETLSQEIQTNKGALRLVAKKMGIKISDKKKLNEEAFEKYFKEHKGKYVLRDGVSFFPRGKSVTVEVPRPHQMKSAGFNKEKASQRVARSQERQFVSSAAFASA